MIKRRLLYFLASSTSDATQNTTSCIRIFDVLFDISFTMAIHVCALCRTTYMSLNNNSPIRRNLSIDATMSLVHNFVISNLGEGIYCFIILLIEHDIGVCVRPHNISQKCPERNLLVFLNIISGQFFTTLSNYQF